jgi:hypothetical protein
MHFRAKKKRPFSMPKTFLAALSTDFTVTDEYELSPLPRPSPPLVRALLTPPAPLQLKAQIP